MRRRSRLQSDGGRTAQTSTSNGDLVVSIDYQTGGASPCIHLRQWVPKSGGGFEFVDLVPTCSAGSAFSATSGDNTPVPCPVWKSSSQAQLTDHYDALQFAEGAINLTCFNINKNR